MPVGKQGKSEGFDSCDRPSNLTQIGFKPSSYSPETPNLGQNWRFFLAVWPWNLAYDLEKQ